MAIIYTVEIIGIGGAASADEWPPADKQIGKKLEITQSELKALQANCGN